MPNANITIKDILERKRNHAVSKKEKAELIDFSVVNPYEITYEEYIAVLDGEINAVNEMLDDIELMSEEELLEKYIEIAKTLNKAFDEEFEEKYNRIAQARQSGGDVYQVFEEMPKQNEKVGYFNLVMEIVKLYDPENLLE